MSQKPRIDIISTLEGNSQTTSGSLNSKGGFYFGKNSLINESLIINSNIGVSGHVQTDNPYIHINANTSALTDGGIVVNYDVSGAVYTIQSISGNDMTLDSVAGLAQHDFIQISGAENKLNNGLYEIDSISGLIVTIKVASTIAKQTFTKDQTGLSGTVRKIRVAVMKVDSASGAFVSGSGLSSTDLNASFNAAGSGITTISGATGTVSSTFNIYNCTNTVDQVLTLPLATSVPGFSFETLVGGTNQVTHQSSGADTIDNNATLVVPGNLFLKTRFTSNGVDRWYVG